MKVYEIESHIIFRVIEVMINEVKHLCLPLFIESMQFGIQWFDHGFIFSLVQRTQTSVTREIKSMNIDTRVHNV